jgi:spore coat protein CotH
VEQIDKTFLDAHLNEKSGNLYKGEWVGGVGPVFTAGHEDGFVLQTNKELGDKSGLTAWFGGLAAGTTPAQLAAWVDVDNVLNYYAGSVLTGHWDSFTYGQNNDHLYHHSDGKFRIITWDVDNTFGSEWSSSSMLESSIYQMRDNDNYQALFKKLLDDPTTRPATRQSSSPC